MKALVIGSGEFFFPYDVSEYIVIACDGGLDHCLENGISPNHILGDFDSVSPQTLEFFKDREKIQYPTRKDMTDLELGIRLAEELGADEMVVTGALSSSRFDHSLCNIQLLLFCLKKGISAKVINKTNIIMLVDKKNKLVVKKEKKYVSLIPLTDTVKGITLEGFEYPLDGYDLKWGSSLCVSNEIKGDTGIVSIKDGILAVISSEDN